MNVKKKKNNVGLKIQEFAVVESNYKSLNELALNQKIHSQKLYRVAYVVPQLEWMLRLFKDLNIESDKVANLIKDIYDNEI